MSTGSGAHSTQPSSPAPTRSPARRRTGEHSALFRLLFENFGLKLLSLVVALGFYASLHTSGTAQRTLEVPIVAALPAPGQARALVSEIPRTLSVTIEGPKTQLDTLDGRLEPLTLDLRGARNETVTFSQVRLLALPRAARVTRIVPETLDVRWEDVIERKVDVQVPIAGQVAPGLELRGEIVVQPKQLTLLGPESLAKSVQLARAEAFDLSGLGEGKHTRNLPLAPPPTKVTFQQPYVEATLEVARKLTTRELTAKVQVIGLARGRAEPPIVRVILAGPPERMATLRPESVLVRVDPKAANVDPMKPGSALMPVIVDVLGADAQADPAQVVVRW